MKTASSLLQTMALSALLAAQVHGALAMPGVRQALRMIAGQPTPPILCVAAIRLAATGTSTHAAGAFCV